MNYLILLYFQLERDNSHVSEILPTVFFIKKQTEKSAAPVAEKLIACLDDRLNQCIKNRRILCTMLCDHRFAYLDMWSALFDWSTVENWIEVYDMKPVSSVVTADSSKDFCDLDSFLDCSSSQSSDKSDDLQV